MRQGGREDLLGQETAGQREDAPDAAMAESFSGRFKSARFRRRRVEALDDERGCLVLLRPPLQQADAIQKLEPATNAWAS
jgi:hypothetical protein